MSLKFSLGRVTLKPELNDLLKSLVKLSPPMIDEKLPPYNEWSSTRKIADANEISIYKARTLLLELVAKGLVILYKSKLDKTLRWYPSVYRSNTV